MRFKEYLSEQNWSVHKSASSNDFEIINDPETPAPSEAAADTTEDTENKTNE